MRNSDEGDVGSGSLTMANGEVMPVAETTIGAMVVNRRKSDTAAETAPLGTGAQA